MKNLCFIILACFAILTACNQEYHFNQKLDECDLIEVSRLSISVADTSKVVDMEQAMLVGQRFMSNTCGSRSSAIEIKDIQLISSDCNPLYYIINYEGGGYIIVSATKSYYPILAYSEVGRFSIEKAKESGVSIWMDMQEEVINNLEDFPDSVKTEISLLWSQYNTKKKNIELADNSRSDPDMTYQISYSISEWQQQGYTVYSYTDFLGSLEYISLTPGERNALSSAANEAYNYGYTPDEIVYIRTRSSLVHSSTVQPLTSTTWNQIYGYNKYVPNFEPDSSKYWPLGCVTVAMAQIMRKHTKPSYFRWDLYPNNYYNDSLAMFLYRVALAANVDFRRTKGSATINDAKDAFVYYGYSHAKSRGYDMDTICKQLSAGRPVYMRGSSNNVGHAWVCDGFYTSSHETEITALLYVGENSLMAGSNWNTIYSQTRASSQFTLSMNWGWGGESNGFYLYTNLTPRPYGQPFNFSDIKIIYDIY